MNKQGVKCELSFYAPFLTNARYSLNIAFNPLPIGYRLIVNTY